MMAFNGAAGRLSQGLFRHFISPRVLEKVQCEGNMECLGDLI